MASSDSKALDLAYLVAALVAESDEGRLRVSETWFTEEVNPFFGSRLKLTNEDGNIYIELEEED